MKRVIIIFAFIALLSTTALPAQTADPKPGSEHKRLRIWMGDWTYEIEIQATPLRPAGKTSGKMSAQPILADSFVEIRGGRKGTTGNDTGWFEVHGYDALQHKYTWVNFASDGSSHSGSYTLDGTIMEYAGTLLSGGKQYKIKGSMVFAADFMSCIEKRELSVDGRNWMPDFEARFIKAR